MFTTSQIQMIQDIEYGKMEMEDTGEKRKDGKKDIGKKIEVVSWMM